MPEVATHLQTITAALAELAEARADHHAAYERNRAGRHVVVIELKHSDVLCERYRRFRLLFSPVVGVLNQPRKRHFTLRADADHEC